MEKHNYKYHIPFLPIDPPKSHTLDLFIDSLLQDITFIGIHIRKSNQHRQLKDSVKVTALLLNIAIYAQ